MKKPIHLVLDALRADGQLPLSDKVCFIKCRACQNRNIQKNMKNAQKQTDKIVKNAQNKYSLCKKNAIYEKICTTKKSMITFLSERTKKKEEKGND